MKTHFTLFIVACQSIVALAQNNDHKTPYLTKSLANDAISNVTVSTSAGGIHVSGESGQAPRIEVYIQGNNGRELSREEIKKHLEEDYDMNISVNGHELSATVKNKHNFTNWKESMSISFKIFVPEQVSTNLKTSGGGIRLEDLKGDENFSTSGGGLDINKVTGMIHGRTSGGGINLSNCNNNIDLETSGGGITARNCTGKMKLITSGGGIFLDDLKGDIIAHTSGGGVEGNKITGELVRGTSGGGIDLKNMDCSLDANTSAGDLNVQMVHVGKYLKLNASSGSIHMALPAKQGLDLSLRGENVNDHILSGFKGEWKRDYVSGSINGGGVPVEAHASSGNVDVKFD